MNIICLVKGHDLQFKEMLNPVETQTRPWFGVDIFGNFIYRAPIKTGWLFYRYFSTCQRCKKRVDAGDLDLPLLYPKDSQNQ